MDDVVRGQRCRASCELETGLTRRHVLRLAAVGLVAPAAGVASAAATEPQLTWGVHVSLAPIWFDPSSISGIITPFVLLYALHDAVVKPMPGRSLAPSLAETWSASEDGTAYGLLKDRVASVEVIDPLHVRFKLKQPWPDFLTFYATATAAGWVVPRTYVEKLGDEGFTKAPIGAGPYKFVSFNPGVELVLEAFDRYWRKTPSVKRLLFKVIHEETTRLAALKRGEVDIAYSIRGELAADLQHTPGLTLKPAVVQGTFCLSFPDQWDAKSPGTTSGCAAPQAWRSTARAPTMPSPLVTRSSAATRSSPTATNSSGNRPR